MLLIGVLIFVSIFKSNCFNIDIDFPIVYEDPHPYLQLESRKSSYFGYSLVLYPGRNIEESWILIGAPRGNSSRINSGVCFKCKIKEKCNIERIPKQNIPLNNNNEIFENAWIGGSMDINYKHKRVVTCAYRWIYIKKRSETKVDDYYIRGSCYWSHINDNTTQQLLPFIDNDVSAINNGASKSYVYYYAQGQAGFSAHMPANEKQLLLGAPGVYNWDGTSILYEDVEESTPVASRLKINKRHASANEFASKNIANTIKTTQTLAYDLLGYSSTSGYFYGKKGALYYASGAPRSSNYQGQVLIYKFASTKDAALDVRESRHGNQFGEYFGGSLSAGDINNDGYDDLIVGAPFHKANRYNEGKIYVFLGSKTTLSKNPITISGQSVNGQFGACVQYLGDINSDGFGDIAVAAPYEDEKSGVLYVYRGNGNGLDINYCQRIAGKDIYPNIRGFGISMSRTADIDSNKYPDVAVGAYLSGHVVLLRTRPTIKIFHNLNSLSPHLDHNEKSFQISACFWFDLNQNVSVNIRRIISVDQQLGRAKLKNSKHKEIIQLSPNQANCQNITISIDNSHSNKVDPITVSLAHEFIAENKPKEVVYVSQDIVGTDGFCETCAVYDKDKSSSLTTVEVPFILGCGSDNICTASLDFEATFTDIGDDNIFVLGSKNYVTLQTVVKNAGEKAYLTQVLVTLPDLINFRSIPSACMEQNTSSVLCSVDNPLESNSQKTTTLDLDMTDVNDGKNDEPLIITVMVLTSSQNIKNNVKYITLKLRREADVTISGKSDEQSYPFRNMAGTPNLFSQTYQVEKSGRSRLNEIQIEIDIPHKFKTKKNTLIDFISLYAPSGNIIAQEIICTSNFNYILESKKDTEGVIDSLTENDDFDQKQPSKRSKRQIEVFNKTTNDVTERLTAGNEFDKLQNRTFYINCSVPEVICSKVICTSGSVKSNQIASIRLKMLLNVSVVKEFLGKKDIIQFATHGSVIVKNPLNFIQSGNKPDSADVTSLFVGDGVEQEVALWIIVVSIIAGLLLLLLIVLGLIKAGFFKRKTKEELEQLKKEVEDDENDVDFLDEPVE